MEIDAPETTSRGWIHEYVGDASIRRNGAYGYFSLKTTVVVSGVWICAGSIMSSEPRLGLAGSIARTKVDRTSSASTGRPPTGGTLWNVASGRSLTVQVMASGDSALRPKVGIEIMWFAEISGARPVLN